MNHTNNPRPRPPVRGEGNLSQRYPRQDRFHLLPEADMREHEMHPNCWCQPKKIFPVNKQGHEVWYHKPLDTRGR